MEYRWLTEDQIVDEVNPALAKRGMALLNTAACKVMGAFSPDGTMVNFLVLQLFPVLGPMVKVDALFADNGEVSRELVTRMGDYLEESKARGYMVIADSPFTQRLCARYGMTPVTSPVYLADGKALECNNYTESGRVQ